MLRGGIKLVMLTGVAFTVTALLAVSFWLIAKSQ